MQHHTSAERRQDQKDRQKYPITTARTGRTAGSSSTSRVLIVGRWLKNRAPALTTASDGEKERPFRQLRQPGLGALVSLCGLLLNGMEIGVDNDGAG